MYRGVSFRDLADAHFDGHPYTARRAVDRMVKGRSHAGASLPPGRKAAPTKCSPSHKPGPVGPGDAPTNRAWTKINKHMAGLVKRGELSHDTAIYRAARIEQAKLIKQGAVLNRVRIDAEMKKRRSPAPARRPELAAGKAAADAARFQAAEATWDSPSKMDGWSTRTPNLSTRHRGPDRPREYRDCDRALPHRRDRRQGPRRVSDAR